MPGRWPHLAHIHAGRFGEPADCSERDDVPGGAAHQVIGIAILEHAPADAHAVPFIGGIFANHRVLRGRIHQDRKISGKE